MRHVIRIATVAVVLAQAEAVAGGRDVTFHDRLRAQEALERVYHSHQIGATKPFEEAVPRAALERKVLTYLKQSAALEEFWHTPVTAEMLERELERMARGTRMPERLRALYAALDDDPILIQECLVRATLVDRLSRSFYASDPRIHAAARREAESLRDALARGTLDPGQEHPDRTEIEIAEGAEGGPSRTPLKDAVSETPTLTLSPEEFARWRERLSRSAGEVRVEDGSEAFHVRVLLQETAKRLRIADYRIEKTPWDGWWETVGPGLNEASIVTVASPDPMLPDLGGGPAPANCLDDDTWDNGSLDDLPDPRYGHTAVWTGSLMVVWGGGVGYSMQTGGRYDPVTDTWAPTSLAGAPSGRHFHTAVWTGSRMVVWGGLSGSVLNTGGRYDPVTDTWTPTSIAGAPHGSYSHTSVWTGSRMVVWGGSDTIGPSNAGGRYDPVTDTWASTSLTGAPSGRNSHTAVWTGSRMVVWGGFAGVELNTGGRYDPVANTWTSTSVAGAISGRHTHTAVWTGNLMVVWGGYDGSVNVLTGGRYDPVADSWTTTTLSGAPSARREHTAVWTGTAMVVWGGFNAGSLNTGGQYDPIANSWVQTSLAGAPAGRYRPSAVWTGSRMVVWGGFNGSSQLNTGGRYHPATNTWTPTSLAEVSPSARREHTAVWTGNLMVVWGGYDNLTLNTGGRYDPVTDAWTPTSLAGAPTARRYHTAVWTGNAMVVWGGQDDNGPRTPLNTGGRYDPLTDTWTPTLLAGAPTARRHHSAVWTGNAMVIWGGQDDNGPGLPLNTGGRYDPLTDTWTPTSLAAAPSARYSHTAVWTGNRVIVWGGFGGGVTGGRYDPATDAWTSTSVAGAPSARLDHTAVWTGNLMVVWGGLEGSSQVNTGGRYDPLADTWEPTTQSGAPAGRQYHTAVWMGSTMVVWGGFPGFASDDGVRYDPVADEWTPTSLAKAPADRYQHTAVWTGSLMVVWGGDSGGYLSTGGRYAFGQATDDDGDGYSECAGDCDDGDAGTFAPPGSVTGLVFLDPVTLAWDSALPGAGSSTVHDVARGSLDELRTGGSETCLDSGIPDASTTDSAIPDPGGYWYLVRGRNACGTGTYGPAIFGETDPCP